MWQYVQHSVQVAIMEKWTLKFWGWLYKCLYGCMIKCLFLNHMIPFQFHHVKIGQVPSIVLGQTNPWELISETERYIYISINIHVCDTVSFYWSCMIFVNKRHNHAGSVSFLCVWLWANITLFGNKHVLLTWRAYFSRKSVSINSSTWGTRAGRT